MFFALLIPAVAIIGALAVSHMASTGRRVGATLLRGYVAQELADGALNEASHMLTPAEVLPRALVSQIDPGADVVTAVLAGFAGDRFSGFQKEYALIRSVAGRPDEQLLVAYRFDAPEVLVPVPGIARELAARTGFVQTDSAEDLQVYARTLSLRREYHAGAVQRWVNWGVVQLRVRVRAQLLRGESGYQLTADRRFTLLADAPANRPRLRVSSHNLRLVVEGLP